LLYVKVGWLLGESAAPAAEPSADVDILVRRVLAALSCISDRASKVRAVRAVEAIAAALTASKADVSSLPDNPNGHIVVALKHAPNGAANALQQPRPIAGRVADWFSDTEDGVLHLLPVSRTADRLPDNGAVQINQADEVGSARR
jgi:hypothetical protein